MKNPFPILTSQFTVQSLLIANFSFAPNRYRLALFVGRFWGWFKLATNCRTIFQIVSGRFTKSPYKVSS